MENASAKSEFNMKDLASELMLRMLDQGKRDELIKGAIAHLLEPMPSPPGSFSTRQPSLLQAAFHGAITDEVRKMVQTEVTNNPEIQQQIREAVVTGFTKFFSSEKLSDLITDKLWGLFDRSR